MKRLYLLVCSALWLSSGTAFSQEDTAPESCEYWLDTHFHQRVNIPVTGKWSTDLDVSALSPGLHTIGFRIGDSKGRWSVPVVKYFLRTQAAKSPTTLSTCTYWIDTHYSEAKTVPFTEGTLNLDLDMSALSKGIHTFTYQASNDKGELSSPVSQHFLIPDLPVYGKNIAAYEYWFNHGPHVRVEVEPANPFSLENMWIDIRDVVPNNIPDNYHFDATNETVYCEDDVFFGLQVYDDAGKGSQAILSDTFHITIPVSPNFIILKDNVESYFSAPTAGKIQGLKIETQIGDSLYWDITPGSVVDFYTEEGTRMETDRKETDQGKTCYSMKAKTEQTYALIHHASDIQENMEVICSVVRPTGINHVLLPFRYYTEKNRLWVESNETTLIRITDLSGRIPTQQTINTGINPINLLPGIYLVRFGNHETIKVLIP